MIAIEQPSTRSLRLAGRLSLMVLSVFMFYLAMPGNPLPLLTWISVVPIYYAMNGLNGRWAALVLFVIAYACTLVIMSWFIQAIIKFTGLNDLLAALVLLVFAMYIAAPYALIGYLAGKFRLLESHRGGVLMSAAMVVLVMFYPTPLPGNYAHNLYNQAEFIQIVDVGGMPLLLFLVMYVNFLLYFGCRRRLSKQAGAFPSALAGLGILAMVFGYGVWRIADVEAQTADAEHLRMGIVQPKLTRQDSIKRLYRLSRNLVQEHPEIDLLVWPEFPTAFSFTDNETDRNNVRDLIGDIRKPMIVVSGYSYTATDAGKKGEDSYYNLTHLINARGELEATYKKQVLVPFFEYVPYEQSVPLLRALFPDAHQYVPGHGNTVFSVEGLNIIPLICYETVFPDITRDFLELGGEVIVNMTNDIWLGNTKGSYYHFAMGMFRAVEHRIPWVRATNSGVSAVVSASGKIDPQSVTPLQSMTTAVYEIRRQNIWSLYSNYGDWFLYGLVLLLAGAQSWNWIARLSAFDKHSTKEA